MAKNTQAQLRKDLKSSFEAIKNSYFWTIYSQKLQEQHDAALLIVRSKADGSEAELRVAAALCSAFHTVLSLPKVLMDGGAIIGPPEALAQEDMEGTDHE